MQQQETKEEEGEKLVLGFFSLFLCHEGKDALEGCVIGSQGVKEEEWFMGDYGLVAHSEQ